MVTVEVSQEAELFNPVDLYVGMVLKWQALVKWWGFYWDAELFEFVELSMVTVEVFLDPDLFELVHLYSGNGCNALNSE